MIARLTPRRARCLLFQLRWSLYCSPFAYAPTVRDRRALVRDALLEGYRDAGGGAVVDQFHANRDCYELLSAVRAMAHLEDWYRMLGLEAEIPAAATAVRTEVERLL